MARSLNTPAGVERMTTGAGPTTPERPAPTPGTQLTVPGNANPAPAPQNPAPATFGAEETEQLRTLLAALSAAGTGHVPAAAAPAPAPAPGPDPFAGARAQVGHEPEVYRPGGEFSFVRDAFRSRFDGDMEAAARFARWQQQLAAFAVETRTTHPDVIPPGYRADLLVEPDVPQRPITSRLTGMRVTLVDATPFSVPIRGAFAGVGDHTEGTAHVAEGALTTGEITVSPKAVSGAFRVSRELVDSSNPAIDQLAMASMTEEYDADAEAYAWARIVGASLDKAGGTVLAALTPVTSIDTAAEVEAQHVAFFTARRRVASFAASGPEFFSAVSGFADTTGRPLYPVMNPTNANGTQTVGADEYGLDVRGVKHVLSDAGGVNGADQSLLIRQNDILYGESAVRQFRFEEVEGPGIIKLALWAYQVCTRMRATGARLLDLDATNP
jgi:HK97 family phage major capsid protein